jgi:hypothetical protein
MDFPSRWDCRVRSGAVERCLTVRARVAKQIDDLCATEPMVSALQPAALLWSHRDGL